MPGERMRVEHLGQRYDVSATPVREALVELAAMGIVKLQPNRGATLYPFGPRQLREIYHIRKILESEAARMACGRIAPFELHELRNDLEQLINAPRNRTWSDRTRAIDTCLHDLIAQRCGNQRLIHEISRYRDLYWALRDLRHGQRQQQSQYVHMEENSEHLAIVLALEADDGEQAALAMSKHIDSSAQLLERELFDAERIVVDMREDFLKV